VKPVRDALSVAAAGAGAPPLAAAAAGPRLSMEDEAFQAFYDRTARPLWAYLQASSGDAGLADDLTQEAFLRLLRAEFQPQNEDHRRAYLFRIAANLLRDHYRGSWRESRQPAPETAVASSAATLEARHDLARFLDRLRPRDRQLLWLAHVEGRSHREIGAALGLREASVRLLLFRARARLAGLLRRAGFAPEAPEDTA
jgi:RNA polymerase sigma-70 factor (ECF subfamily)